MNKVEILFKDQAVIRGGIFLFSKENAFQFIEECRNRDIAILGVDGFFITDVTTQPSMENSVDFSRGQFYGNIYDEAVQFIEGRGNNLYFEIVCSE